MTFIVYNTNNLQAVKEYKYEGAALNKLFVLGSGYSLTTKENFLSLPVPTKKVKNLMTDTMIEIPVNTPRCCDPSTETYWSM
jgi:hypothetical protein